MHHHYKKGVFGMAKKGWGKFVAFAAVTGAVAAGVSYVLQYKTYHRELEKDFREFEDGVVAGNGYCFLFSSSERHSFWG